MKQSARIFALIAALLMSFGFFACRPAEEAPAVEKVERMCVTREKGRDFKILQLTDIQIIDPAQQPYSGRLTAADAERWTDVDRNAFDQVRALVAAENPDYIVLTGDNVYGQFDGDGSNFIALVNLMDSFCIPWSFVNGNHDGEIYVTHNGERIECGKGMAWQAEYVREHTKYCLYEAGDPVMGYGNYLVDLKEGEDTVYTFVMMDTHGCDSAAGLNADQIAWYRESIAQVSGERYGKKDLSVGVVPSLLFFHIPTKQHFFAMLQYNTTSRGLVTRDGQPNEVGDFGANFAEFNGFESAPLWAAVTEMNSTKGIFVGHEHVNNASILYQGIRLTFGTKTGTYDTWFQQGGTRIVIGADNELTVTPVYAEGSQYGL